MDFSDFVLALIEYDIKNISRLNIPCDTCPLRAECRASADNENETCAEFLEKMLKV